MRCNMTINWEETTYGYYRADIGNYIRLEIIENKNNVWSLYLSIRVFKEDGADSTKVCQYQKVATLSSNDIRLAKTNAEKWYKEFVLEQVKALDFGLTELLR